jgi:hypothetical protein
LAALEQARQTGDPREQAEVYLAAAKAERICGEISPELSVPGEEAYRLFEKYSGRHRLFELLLVIDNADLSTFLAEFPLPDNFNEVGIAAYTGPAAHQGLWLWRLAQKARTEGQTTQARRLLTSLAQWCRERELAEWHWRAEMELGILYHTAHDYEMAAQSFAAALRRLQKIAGTIPSPDDRRAYLAHEDVLRLNQQMQEFSKKFTTT